MKRINKGNVKGIYDVIRRKKKKNVYKKIGKLL
jgi:hypothetical protein